MSWLKNKLKSFINELFLDDLKKEIKADLLHVRMRIYREINQLKLDEMYIRDFKKPAQDTSCVTSQTPLNFVFFDYTQLYHPSNMHNLGDFIQTIVAKNAIFSAFGIKNDLNAAICICDDYVKGLRIPLEHSIKASSIFNKNNKLFQKYSNITSSYFCSSRLNCFRSEANEINIAINQAYIGGGVPTYLPSYDIRCLWHSIHYEQAAKDSILLLNSVRPDFWNGVEVGARDRSTLEFFKSLGVKSYFSRCLTLTLPLRSKEQEQKADKVFLVNLDDDFIKKLPSSITQNAAIINQRFIKVDGIYDEKHYFDMTRNLLMRYANEASLVITSAVHCAGPCIAMGIPVVLVDFCKEIGKDNERFSIFDGILRVYKPEDVDKIDFNNIKAPNIEDLKVAMLKNVSLSLEALLTGKKDPKLDELRDFISNYKVNI